MKMCAALARLGHQVTLLVPDAKSEQEKTALDVFEFYNVPNDFDVHYVTWPSVKGKGLIFAYLAARRASVLSPNLIYGRNISACFFSSKLSKAKVAYESHAPIKSEGRLLNAFFNSMRCQKNFIFLTVITHALKKYYQEHYSFSSNKILVLPDGADPVASSAAKSISTPKVGQQILTVGYIGSFHKGKGLEKILELIQHYDRVEYHIVGGSAAQVQTAKDTLGNRPNVVFHGFLPQKEAEKIRQQCDILLAPYGEKVGSVGSTEISQWMSPLKIFEYMSAGKPIVSTDLPVLREVLNESNSILVKGSTISDWIDALERLQNASLRQQLGEKAKQDFENYYTWDARAKKLIDEATRA